LGCEVISPSTGRLDRLKKIPLYAREGIEYAWIVDPILRAIEVDRLIAGRWSLLGTFGGEDVVRMEPFDAVEFRLATLWMPESSSA
jgi:Uma2 family endonuclease